MDEEQKKRLAKRYREKKLQDFTYDELRDEVPEDESRYRDGPSVEEVLEQLDEQKKDRLLTITAASAYTNVSAARIKEAIRVGDLPATQDPNRPKRWLIREYDLDEYLEKIGGLGDRGQMELSPLELPMTDETEGLVTILQAANYLDRSVEHVRKLFHKGILNGVPVGGAFMVMADDVRAYSGLTSGRYYRPKGVMHIIVFDKAEKPTMEQLELIHELGTIFVRLWVNLMPEGVKKLQEAGLQVTKRKYSPAPKNKRKAQELPEEYKELLKQIKNE